ncbi:hypothetical protein [Nocardioides sp.]|uniref:hypothetical protein n=1 Tax=Nocardioides sp. TaxID=35761 RepID=UPI0037831262
MTALGTRQLVLTIGGTDYTAQVSNCEITSQAAESDVTTFAEAAAGGAREYRLKFTGLQDLTTGTIWDKVWSAAGSSVAALVKPYGNSTASPTQPHYSGNVTITEPDGTLIGGDADASTTSRWTFECEWVFSAKPTKVTS